jgi:hypothetical protein
MISSKNPIIVPIMSSSTYFSFTPFNIMLLALFCHLFSSRIINFTSLGVTIFIACLHMVECMLSLPTYISIPSQILTILAKFY